MGPFSNLYIQGSECGAFYFAGVVDLREKQRVGFAVTFRTMHRGMRGLLLVCDCSGRPGTEHMARGPPLFKVTLRVASVGPIAIN